MRFAETIDESTRRKTRFLWLPKTIGGETRWLERASWVEEWRLYPEFLGRPLGSWWSAVAWVPDPGRPEIHPRPLGPWLPPPPQRAS